MKKINFEININATAKIVWQVLWSGITYRKWTSVFSPGSYAVSDWNEGSRIHFLTSNGEGMYSQIEANKANEFMSFQHLGKITNFEEQPQTEETKVWANGREKYFLSETNKQTTLRIELDAPENFADYFSSTFPQAITLVKELSEKPIEITVGVEVNCSVEKVWEFFNLPQHITKWNHASDDWHTPKATNNLIVGDKFVYTMAAKDGSFSFDFEGVYTNIVLYNKIEYSIADGRKVCIKFSKEENVTKVVEAFEAETENAIELQYGGWQAILNSFKNYCESTK